MLVNSPREKNIVFFAPENDRRISTVQFFPDRLKIDYPAFAGGLVKSKSE